MGWGKKPHSNSFLNPFSKTVVIDKVDYRIRKLYILRFLKIILYAKYDNHRLLEFLNTLTYISPEM